METLIKSWVREDPGIVKITRSRDAHDLMQPILGDIPYEEFWIILLNRQNGIIDKVRISDGGISGTVVDPKKIFKIALDKYACSMILIHNHPSGKTNPSEADIKITNSLVKSGDMIEIKVLDHLIITREGFYSFADEGAI